MRARAEAGFTLIELMVALAIFGLAAIALINLQASSLNASSRLETRTFAQVIAENQAVEVMTAPPPLPVGTSTGAEQLAGREWEWTQEVAPTADPDILRIDIAVTEAGRDGVVSALTVFRGLR